MNHLTDEQLSAYMDGALKGRDAEEIGRHLAGCQPCQEALAELAEQDAALRPVLAHDPGEAYFESFAARVEEQIAAAETARQPRAPSRGLWLGRFFRSPRALAWAGGVAVVVVGGGLALMSGRDIVPSRVWQRERAVQVEREAPSATPPVEPAVPETRPAPEAVGEAIVPPPSAAAQSAEDAQPNAVAPTLAKDEAARAPAMPPAGTREADKMRADATPPPSAVGDGRKAGASRAFEVRRNEAGEEVPVRRLGEQPSPATAPGPAPALTGRVRRTRAAQPLDAAKESAPAEPLAASGAGQESAARMFSAAPPARQVPQAPSTPARDAAGEGRLCGEVRDDGGRPVAGAHVVLSGLGRGTTTDARGRFCLGAPRGEHELSVMAVGYRDTRQPVRIEGAETRAGVTLQAVAVLEEKRAPAAGRVALPTQPIGPPATDRPVLLDGPYGALPDTLQGLVREAMRLEADAAARRSAAHYDMAAGAWQRALARLMNGPAELETRRHLAEARYRAWELGHNSRRARVAVEALTAYLTRAPAGPGRDQAIRWLDRVRL